MPGLIANLSCLERNNGKRTSGHIPQRIISKIGMCPKEAPGEGLGPSAFRGNDRLSEAIASGRRLASLEIAEPTADPGLANDGRKLPIYFQSFCLVLSYNAYNASMT